MLRLRKGITSKSFSYSRIWSRISNLKLPSNIVASAVMGISIFLLGGGIYDIAWQPLAYLPFGSRFLSFIPFRIHEQLLIGSIGVMILYSAGAFGLLLLYHSTGHLRNPRQFSILFLIGIILLLIAFIIIESTVFWILNFQ